MTAASLPDLLERWAVQAPDRPFLAGQTSSTYAQAWSAVRRESERMDHARPVFLARPNDAAWVIEALAALRAKAPLVLLPPSWTPAERASIERWTAQVAGDGAWRESGAALAFATSGTTGLPRLALRGPASLAAEGARYVTLWRLRADDVLGAVLPLYHAYTFGAALAATLVAGATLVVGEPATPRATARAIDTHRMTILPLVVPLVRALAELDRGRPVSTSLRVAMVGAGPVTPALAAGFAAKWGVALSQNYGSSETGATLACFAPDAGTVTGVPLDDIDCDLVEHAGGVGQLWVRMAEPPIGYVAAGGVARAQLAPGGWWATGDLFRRDERGRYVFHGRLDDRIRRGGRTIDPREVEAAIASHPAIADVHVQAGRRAGEDDTIEAHVAPHEGSTVTAAELRCHLETRLAEYKLPTAWHALVAVPRTWSGKPAADRAVAPGEPSRLFQALLSSRLSQAVLAADEIGLWTALAAAHPVQPAPRAIAELAAELGVDVAALTMLARCLADAGLVRLGDGMIAPVEPPPDPAIVALERHLSTSWLTSGALVSVLRSGVERRAFERTPDPELARRYAGALCGRAARGLARLAASIARLMPEQAALEIGRGVGLLTVTLGRPVPFIALAPPPAILAPEVAGPVPVSRWSDIVPDRGAYQLILIVNSAHWLTPANRSATLRRLLDGLRPDGCLAFIDAFLQEPAPGGAPDPNAPLVIDWLTHGGTHTLTARELGEALVEAGAVQVHHRGSAQVLSIVSASPPRAPRAVPSLRGVGI